MLTVDHYARIRQLRRDGLTIRQIAEQLNHSPKTILKALAHPEPEHGRRTDAGGLKVMLWNSRGIVAGPAVCS